MSHVLEEDLIRTASRLRGTPLAGSRIAVTGATGLIGSLLIKTLLKYNELYGEPIGILGIARNPDKVRAVFGEGDPHLQIVCGDISASFGQNRKCRYIVHTACPTVSDYLNRYPAEVMSQIYDGTRAVLEYGRSHDVERILFLSSMEAFGVVEDTRRRREEELGYLDLRNVRNCYPEAKRLAELLCRAYAKEYGVPAVTARLAQTFGAGISPGENRVFAQFARSAMKGEDIILHTDGSSTGNYCYTSDVIAALLLLLEKGEAGETYTVANEESTMTIAQMAQLVAGTFSEGRSSVVFDIPEGNRYGYAAATKLHLSAEKLRALGWKPEVSQEEAFRRMIRYLQETSSGNQN